MTCLTCQEWNLRAAPNHARLALAACKRGESYVFMHASKTCDQHQSASASDIQKRVDYFSKTRIGS